MPRFRTKITTFILLSFWFLPMFANTSLADEQVNRLSIGAGPNNYQQLMTSLVSLLLEKKGFTITTKQIMNQTELQPMLTKGTVDLCFLDIAVDNKETPAPATVRLQPFSFPVGPALLMRSQLATANKIKTIQQLAKQMKANPQQYQIADTDTLNAKRLAETYELPIVSRQPLPPALLYRSLKNNRTDVALGRADDGRIIAFRLVALTDDQQALPDLRTTPVISKSAHAKYPIIATTLARLHEHLDTESMQRMHGAVVIAHRKPRTVAEDWLRQNGLL
ncbi:MAG: hypothetical protein OEL55_05375 [Desulfobulbaceae bacterium]|nr:hypothetical protein [Desulfobulbaceae bacterium]